MWPVRVIVHVLTGLSVESAARKSFSFRPVENICGTSQRERRFADALPQPAATILYITRRERSNSTARCMYHREHFIFGLSRRMKRRSFPECRFCSHSMLRERELLEKNVFNLSLFIIRCALERIHHFVQNSSRCRGRDILSRLYICVYLNWAFYASLFFRFFSYSNLTW